MIRNFTSNSTGRLILSTIHRSFGCSVVPVSLISQLRKDTGASIQRCKEALEKSNSCVKTAIEFLRKRGENINCTKSGASGAASRISGCLSSSGEKAVIIKTVSQTDFASESEVFVKFSETVSRTLLQMNTLSLDCLELIGSFSPQIHTKRLSDVISEMSCILTEPISIPVVEAVEGDLVSMYIHNKSPYSINVGSVVSAVAFNIPKDLSDEQRAHLSNLGNRIARQIVAINPMYVDSSSIPPEVVQREKELIRSRIQKAEMLEKAFKGHMAKFSSENCLLDIEWIIPPVNGLETEGKTVGKVIELECREIGLGPRSVSISRFVVVK